MRINLKPACHRKCPFSVALIILLICTVFLFLGGPDYESSRSFKDFWDMGHIFYFALATWLLSKWSLISRQSTLKQWLIVLIITLIIGVLIEVLQYGTNRNPDMGDVARDLTGSFLFLSFSTVYSKTIILKWKILVQTIAISLVSIQLWPLTISLIDEAIARKQFPVLANFETPFEKHRWNGSAGLKIKNIPLISNSDILEVPLTTTRYSGVGLKYFPHNWRNYKNLTLSIYQPNTTPLRVICRIHDWQHTQGIQRYNDRFNRRFILTQGWNKIEIKLSDIITAPKHRIINIEQIQEIDLFTTRLRQSQIIYLDNIELTN